MISGSLKLTLATLALVVGSGALVLLHLDNRRLRLRLAESEKQQSRAATLHAENTRLQQLLTSDARGAGERATTVRAQLHDARAEIAALEKHAAARYAEKTEHAAREAAQLEHNRDPRLGPVRPEHFKNLGRATPTAAFQTLVWAGMAGDEAEIARLCSAPEKARAEAKALIAGLPEAARATWTPEKLAALWVSGAFTEMAALQIVGERFEDPNSAVVSFRIQGRDDVENVKLRLSPTGWQVMLPSNAVAKLEKKLGVKTIPEPSK